MDTLVTVVLTVTVPTVVVVVLSVRHTLVVMDTVWVVDDTQTHDTELPVVVLTAGWGSGRVVKRVEAVRVVRVVVGVETVVVVGRVRVAGAVMDVVMRTVLTPDNIVVVVDVPKGTVLTTDVTVLEKTVVVPATVTVFVNTVTVTRLTYVLEYTTALLVMVRVVGRVVV
jgi:hypothetical protein